MTNKKEMSIRTAQWVINEAYVLKDLAQRLRHDGYEGYAVALFVISRALGVVGRSMLYTAERNLK